MEHRSVAFSAGRYSHRVSLNSQNSKTISNIHFKVKQDEEVCHMQQINHDKTLSKYKYSLMEEKYLKNVEILGVFQDLTLK